MTLIGKASVRLKPDAPGGLSATKRDMDVIVTGAHIHYREMPQKPWHTIMMGIDGTVEWIGDAAIMGDPDPCATHCLSDVWECR